MAGSNKKNADDKKTVKTPVHLLQQLTGTLLDHLKEACSASQAEAEKVLVNLEKQRLKVQAKLQKAQNKLARGISTGKAKVEAKAQKKMAELEDILHKLNKRQKKMRDYIELLKNDSVEALRLSEGITKVKLAVDKVLHKRQSEGAKADTAPQPAKVVKAKVGTESRPVTRRRRTTASVKTQAAGSTTREVVAKDAVTAGKTTAKTTTTRRAGTTTTRRTATARKPVAEQAKPAESKASVAQAESKPAKTKTTVRKPKVTTPRKTVTAASPVKVEKAVEKKPVPQAQEKTPE